MANKRSSESYEKACNRTRNWVFIVYPESAPENWRTVLDETTVEWCESPLHDKDTNDDGSHKKDHIHVLMMYESVKTYEQVREVTQLINAANPQRCLSKKGSVRYFAHLDNPEKYQYNLTDIVAHNGFDVSEVLKPSNTERYYILKKMLQYIRDNKVMDYCDLVDFAMDNELDDWFEILADRNTFFINSYITSNREKEKARQEREKKAQENN